MVKDPRNVHKRTTPPPAPSTPAQPRSTSKEARHAKAKSCARPMTASEPLWPSPQACGRGVAFLHVACVLLPFCALYTQQRATTYIYLGPELYRVARFRANWTLDCYSPLSSGSLNVNIECAAWLSSRRDKHLELLFFHLRVVGPISL